MDVEDLDKLVGVAKRAFNYATKEKRKAYLRLGANKLPVIKRALEIDTPGAEFFIWNEANPLVPTSNSGDPWYKEFYELHTSADAFTKSGTLMLTKVEKYFKKPFKCWVNFETDLKMDVRKN